MDTALARRRLDDRVAAFPRNLAVMPPRGWIAAVRQALGMSVRELGERMGVSGQRASRLEHDEMSGRIQVASLERAAEAMNCRLVYLFVPNESFEETVRAQALRKAEEELRDTWHTMRLEDQAVEYDAAEKQLDERARELLDRRGLWSA